MIQRKKKSSKKGKKAVAKEKEEKKKKKVEKKSSKKAAKPEKKKKASKEKESSSKSDRKGPYRDSSLIGMIFNAALKTATIKELTKIADKEGGDLTHSLRMLRKASKEGKHGFKWSMEEANNKVKIFNVRKGKA